MAQTVELPDVLDSAIEASLRGVWTAMPGRVESYNSATQAASIQLTVRSGYVAENGERQSEAIAILNTVPVVHVGGGGYRTVYPVAKGDTALVVFTSRSMAQWLVQGDLVDPGTDQHHSLSDAVAIVGLRDHKHALAHVPTDRMSVGSDSGASIEITTSDVRVGGFTGTEPTIKATAYRGAEDTLLTAQDTFLTALATYIAAIKGVADPSEAATPTLATAIGTMKAAIGIFKASAGSYVSSVARVK